MTFWQAVASVFTKYATFGGRASRPEYWWFVLFCFLVNIGTMVVDWALGISATGLLWALATFIPSLAVTVRRLHDIDRSGWWLLIILVPLVGIVLLIVWYCKQGTAGPNRFGETPAS